MICLPSRPPHAVYICCYWQGPALIHLLDNHMLQKPQNCLLALLGAGFEARAKEPVCGYPSRVRSLYPRHPCSDPFPNHFPTPRSVRRCNMVFCLPHRWQFSVSTSLILCNLKLVGIVSCFTMYHTDLAPSKNLTLSTDGWSCMMRTSRGLFLPSI
jgi:hypothetical protein